MWTPRQSGSKIAVLVVVTVITLGIHYGWLIRPFGHLHWIHAIHGRFCYIPIVIAAAWFGLRGGLIQAAVISTLILPYVLGSGSEPHDMVSELVEIVFYFAIAILVGFLVDREFLARRRQQEAELRLERSQKLSLAGQIAAGVAHEIKNPLASIKGAADILIDEHASDADRKEFRDILNGEVRRIDATVTEFLEFARPRETRLERIDLTGTLKTSVRQMEAHAGQGGISLNVSIPEGIEVDGDPEKLHQLMLNLLINAIQASAAGSRIDVSATTENGSRVKIVVADSGCGIAPDRLERIFEPFFTTRSSGVGLGLPVVRAIVESHGGDIQIESREGQGTRFTIVLPVAGAGGVA